MQSTKAAAAASILILLAGCGSSGDDERSATASTATDTPAAAAPALPRTAAPDGARVFFLSPEDGATVSSPFRVEFGAANVTIVPAGDMTPDSGHHHLLINTDVPAADLPIPKDAAHIHFGDGSTSTELDLPPGQHTLTLLLGDYLHIPHDPPVVSESITVTVE